MKMRNWVFILGRTRKLSTDEQTFINFFSLLNFNKVFGIHYNLFCCCCCCCFCRGAVVGKIPNNRFHLLFFVVKELKIQIQVEMS